MSSNAVEMENITLHFPKQTNAVKLIINLLKRKKRAVYRTEKCYSQRKKGRGIGSNW